MRDLKRYVTGGLLVLGVFLYIQYQKPSPVNWSKTYVKTDKIPYGTYVLYQQLSPLFGNIAVQPHQRRIYNTLETLGGTADTYVLIAPHIDIDGPDYGQLVNYVEKGNDLFMASYDYGRVFVDSLDFRINTAFSLGDNVTTVSFTNPKLNPDKKYRYDSRIESGYFARFDTLNTTVLAVNEEGHAVFLRYKIGLGNVYLLASPDYFINYALLTSDGADFAAKALSYLDPKRQIIWDDYQTLGDIGQQSPMRVFLNDDHLRPAYLIALFSLLAFVIYGIKRRQRVIPVVVPLQNTSLEFAKVISAVYYHQRNNKDILIKQYTYFMEHVRSAYRIKTDESAMADFVQQVSARSGVAENIILHIVQGARNADGNIDIDDKTLIAYNRNIEFFYQQTTWKNNISNSAQI